MEFRLPVLRPMHEISYLTFEQCRVSISNYGFTGHAACVFKSSPIYKVWTYLDDLVNDFFWTTIVLPRQHHQIYHRLVPLAAVSVTQTGKPSWTKLGSALEKKSWKVLSASGSSANIRPCVYIRWRRNILVQFTLRSKEAVRQFIAHRGPLFSWNIQR